jgi:hypothetical protein
MSEEHTVTNDSQLKIADEEIARLRKQLDTAIYEAKLANEGFETIEKQDTILRKQLEVARMKLIKIVNHSVDGNTTWCEDYWHLKDIAKDALDEIEGIRKNE